MRRVEIDLASKGRGDGFVSGYAFGAYEGAPQIVFLHANGFNARTYASLLEPLGARARSLAIDLRGHGRTTLPADPARLRSWTVFRDDLIAVLESVAPGGAILAGHSMGATTALMAAAARPDLARALVLVDPVILPQPTYAAAAMPGSVSYMKRRFPIARQALRRRRFFESQKQAEEAFTGRGAFRTWREPFLKDYLADGLAYGGPDGLLKLSCAPEWEAACFAAQRNPVWSALKAAPETTVILGAETGSTICSAARRLFERRDSPFRFQSPAGTTHFLPMESPYVVRDALAAVHAVAMEDGSPDDLKFRRSLTVQGEPD